MTDPTPRLFSSADEIVRIGEEMIACVLPKEKWTHEAHLSTCLWIVRDRHDLVAERDMPMLISRYNESVGGVNSDTEGYHETITQTYIAAVRAHLRDMPSAASLEDAVNALLLSPRGRRDWPLRFYSKDRLFSVDARRNFVKPDL